MDILWEMVYAISVIVIAKYVNLTFKLIDLGVEYANLVANFCLLMDLIVFKIL